MALTNRYRKKKMQDIYQQILMDHFKNPRRHFALPEVDVCRTGANPLCGDSITLYLGRRPASAHEPDGARVELSFEGRGCAISQASASIMVASLNGLKISSCRDALDRSRAIIQGQQTAGDDDNDSDLAALATIHRYPARLRCALLAWDTLADALCAISVPGADPCNT